MNWKKNVLLTVFFSLMICFLLLRHVVAANDSEIDKLPTNCTLVGDYYECNATTNVTENSTFVVSIGEKVNCPYACCINEVNYTDKNCTSGYQCKNNKCVSTSTGISFLENDNTVFIIIGAGLGIIVLVLIAYLVLKRSRSAKPSKNFDELYKKYGKRGVRRPVRRSRR